MYVVGYDYTNKCGGAFLSINKKLKAITVSGSKQIPVVGLFVDAIDSERTRLKQENIEEVMEKVLKNVEDLRLDMSVSSDDQTSKTLSEIFKEVEGEYEELKRDSYSILLTNIIHAKNNNIDNQRVFSEVLYQLKDMTGNDIKDFVKMYLNNMVIKEYYKDKDIIGEIKKINSDFTDEDAGKVASELEGFDFNNVEISGLHIKEEEFSRITIQKFLKLGLLQIPRHVEGNNTSSFYKPSLTKEADNFYNYCLTFIE